ncbi:SDR family oxidoreductase [Streptomyces sp. NPDC057386]|uniref:SDR family oxidoreductase n=1 Tax=unclassified Streptomyces TaxID=2593676 RepID=UPI0036396FF6
MRVFVTGATGFVGSAVVRELLDAGHQVVGLARSDRSAAALKDAGAEAHRGDLDDLDALRAGAAAADGVIHLAFVHDFDRYDEAALIDRRAIEALGEELAGSDRPFVVTSGTALVAPGRVATEEDPAHAPQGASRASEQAALAFAERGVRVSAVRLSPTVHGEGDHGFVPRLIEIAREKGVSGYPGDGANRWPAVHRTDAARLFRLALESAPTGARFHGVAEEGVPVREIAEAIGRGLGLPVTSVAPEDVPGHFGWISAFWSLDIPASGRLTRERLGWEPTGEKLIADLDAGHYFR